MIRYYRSLCWLLCALSVGTVCGCVSSRKPEGTRESSSQSPTSDDGKWFLLSAEDVTMGAHHTRHAEVFGRYVSGYNRRILEGIDAVQSHAMDGGGYFIGVRATPPESPVGYELRLFGRSLLTPPRPTSYCSGASYAAFVEGMNRAFPGGSERLSEERWEALRMQEPDGGRREDGVKFWGHWNDDGFGSQFALVQYSGTGAEILPIQARPGDFMNISWKNGGGHSVVFLGWYQNDLGEKHLLYWASQKATNGYGDQLVSLDRVREVKAVRVVNPEMIFEFDVASPVNRGVPGNTVSWGE